MPAVAKKMRLTPSVVAALGVFEGKGFADAVFSIWLGPKPPSEDLRKGMLG